MRSPFFSVIIPALNEARALPYLLKDLALQTFTDFDIWIVDGHSTDTTLEIARKYTKKDARIHVIASPKTHVSAQRNYGAEKSTGQQLVFFDADSRIPKHFLEGIHYNLMRDSCDAWTTWCAPDRKKTTEMFITKFINIGLDSGILVGLPYALGASMGASRKVFKKVGRFDEHTMYMEDAEFVRRVSSHNYDFCVFHDPIFTCSFRRFRKEGTLLLFGKMIPPFIRSLMNQKIVKQLPDYPMLGGAYYTKKYKKNPPFDLQEFEKIMRKLLKSRRKMALQLLRKITEER